MPRPDERKFIRHPTDIPVEVQPVDEPAARRRVRDVGAGGLSFRSDAALTLGSVVNLRIASVQPAFESTARVVWCRAAGRGYELGVAFLSSEEAFRARMVEQVCHIEHYRRQVRDAEGRELTAEEAALEWIARNAAQFPEAGPETRQ
jgi:phage tail tape-measure protein